ncbi:MAG: PTS sugar transporter subunit IIC [Deltaproteobacteria bacterium]|nr:PTS sugar transporter subunit IIC [Deltaproteobacteria bacterium]
MLVKVAILSLLGGILCLDRVTLQLMISRPVVAGPIIGLVLGDPHMGLISGALVELLWIDRLAVGAYVPPHDTIVAVLVTAGSIIGGMGLGPFFTQLVAFSVLLYLPAGILAQRMDVWIRQSNDTLARAALEEVKAGNIRAVPRNHLRALLRTWIFTTAFIFIAALAGIFFTRLVFPALPASVLKMLHYIYFFLPLLGIGVALNTIKNRGAIPVFCGVFLILSAVKEFLWT